MLEKKINVLLCLGDNVCKDSSGLWVAVGSTSNGDQKVWVSTDAGATWTG